MVEGFVISPASAAAPAASAVTLAPGSLQPPVAPACVSSPFGPRRLVGPHAATFHTGIDFPAPVGAVVRAVAPGQVVTIRRLGADGLEVDVKHDGADGGFVTRYAHLGTVVPALAEGRRDLAGGAPIGRVGRTGVTYGTHVHFEIRVHDQPIDPEPFFNVRRCQ
jgi:murein DD-endopeptidase MepM/ murein hydrolase activator NlpD